MTAYLLTITIFALIYSLLALGLNLHWGHTGLINFGHVAFFAMGAYASALLTRRDVPIVGGMVVAIVAAGLLAYPMGYLKVRLKADYLAIVTIAFSEILRLILLNASWTGGPNGVTGVPRLFPGLRGRPYDVAFLLATLLAVVVVFWLLDRLIESPYGRVLWAIRENEAAAESLGKDSAAVKTTSLVIGAAVAGLAGSLYAHYVNYVVPDQFLPLITFYVWTGIILGGNSHLGAAVGTFVLMALMEGSRFLGDFGFPVSETKMAYLRFIIVGLVLILLLRFRPEGLLPYRKRPVPELV